MKYPPKQTRSTCHCKVFVSQKTNTSNVYSKTKYEEATPLLLHWYGG